MTEIPPPAIDTPPASNDAPKINPWTTAPDSAWLAEWALQAMTAGRIEMGYQLSRLAVMAHRYEQQEPQHAAAEPPIIPGPEQTAVLKPVDPIVSGRCAVRTPGGRDCFGVAVFDPIARAWTHMEDDLDRLHAPVVPSNEIYDDRIERQS